MALRATKLRIYPDADQRVFLDRQFGAVRFVYNKALHAKTHFYYRRGISLHPTHDLKKLLKPAKRSRRYAWLAEFDAMALQQSCINLTRAYEAFFKGRGRYPRFKRKHGPQSSYHCTGAMAVGTDWITIPKAKGKIRARVHREIIGKVKSITLSRSPTGKYYASVLVDDGQEDPALPSLLDESRIRGLDAGLTDLLVDDRGHKITNPKHLSRARASLRRAQKSLSRKKKGSQNRAKARKRLARAHERVAHARADLQHKISRKLVDENQAIIAETLGIKGMMKNHRLAGAIADAGWSSLMGMIAYKASSAGVVFHKIDQWEATTKTCSGCGHKVAVMPLHIRSWNCPTCGADHDRDVNAAINVRRIGIDALRASGLRVQACGGLCKTHDHAQRPTEAGNKVA